MEKKRKDLGPGNCREGPLFLLLEGLIRADHGRRAVGGPNSNRVHATVGADQA